MHLIRQVSLNSLGFYYIFCLHHSLLTPVQELAVVAIKYPIILVVGDGRVSEARTAFVKNSVTYDQGSADGMRMSIRRKIEIVIDRTTGSAVCPSHQLLSSQFHKSSSLAEHRSPV